MPLCKNCGAIDARRLISELIRRPWPRATYDYYESALELRDGSESGCELCNIIWGEVDEKLLGIILRNNYQPNGGPIRFEASAHRESKADINLSGSAIKYMRLEFFPIPGSDLVEEEDIMAVLSRYMDTSTGSPHTLQTASEWLHQCKVSHSQCSSGHSGRLPTRVIDVGSATKMPRLLETSASDGHWVALSYCWGRDASFILTSASKARLEQGVSLEAFPATLRDAIMVTRSLGIPYIWIDALCIIQDSIEDWRREAPQMKNVYSNADLVIVATAADDVNAGIFSSRSVSFARLPWVYQDEAGAVTQNDKSQVIGIRLKYDSTRFDEDQLYRGSRWMSRGWTMQEDFLARRLLVFTKHTMTWECLEHAERENGQHITEISSPNRKTTRDFMSRYWKRWMAVLRANSDSGSDKQAPLGEADDTKSLEDISKWANATPYEMWNNTIVEYSKRRLTKHGDRLPALSGLAALFHEITGDTYYAGLWKNDLVRGLLWRYDAHRSYRGERVYKWTPPVGEAHIEKDVELTNNGPSWSWASLEGDLFELKMPSEVPQPGKNGMAARILNIWTEPITENDSFGSVLRGELTIEADSIEWDNAHVGKSQSKTQGLVAELLQQPQRQRGFNTEYQLRHQAHPGQITAVLLLGFDSEEATMILIETIKQPQSEHRQNGTATFDVRPHYRRVGRFGPT
ncbi:heterokaryon incompatibility protein-domain-containing protein [Xylariaceae sp. FL1651]|nr:heterokaryon incompatibility protein-domain-containing protein [Xylariaceae sp. FL1651]